METVGVITARADSKSIPKKSIAPCAGQPLMYYTIEAAKRASSLSRLIICTDSEEMADYARAQGIEVPFMEPKELTKDEVPDLPIFTWVLKELKKQGYSPDAVMQLRPTTPLKKTEDIERAIELMKKTPEADSVRSVCEPMHTPFKMYRLNSEGLLDPLLQKEFPDVYQQFNEPYNENRQLLPSVWRHSGYVDIVRSTIVEAGGMSGKKILPLFIEKWRDIDIDSPLELAMAEEIIEKIRETGKEPWE